MYEIARLFRIHRRSLQHTDLLFLPSSNLCLCDTSDLLLSVFPFFSLLSCGLWFFIQTKLQPRREWTHMEYLNTLPQYVSSSFSPSTRREYDYTLMTESHCTQTCTHAHPPTNKHTHTTRTHAQTDRHTHVSIRTYNTKLNKDNDRLTKAALSKTTHARTHASTHTHMHARTHTHTHTHTHTPTLANLYFGSNFFMKSTESYMSANPVLFPPPNLVLNPKATTQSDVVLYIFASCSLISFFGTLALSGWMTSTTCTQEEGTRRVMEGQVTKR